ncbi:MAG: hypothetical protein D6818_10345 [Bacteroidetes bacterium]|nr:MAG: hypothetical protein D6818_10345 [Bacteroidota bacterium]
MTGASTALKVLVFEWNRQQLEQFCVNANKPEKACHAHCYLAQRLGKDQPDTPAPALPKLNKQPEFLSLECVPVLPLPKGIEKHRIPVLRAAFPSSDFIAEVFHPPCG